MTLQTAGMMARVIGRFWASARAPKKTRPAGAAFLNHLKERGHKGVRLIISGACMGLSESAAEFCPDAAWQRCDVVQWYRNVFSQVPSIKVREIAAMLKAILPAVWPSRCFEKVVQAIEKWRGLRPDCRKRGQTDGRLIHFPRRSIGAGSGPITHWNASCARQAAHPCRRCIRGRSALDFAKRYLNIELLKDQQMRGAITVQASAERRSAQTNLAKNLDTTFSTRFQTPFLL